MNEIPKSIKIDGKEVIVKASPRGYIMIGETTIEMRPELKEYCNSAEGEEHEKRWSTFMYQTFKKAVSCERTRLRRLKEK